MKWFNTFWIGYFLALLLNTLQEAAGYDVQSGWWSVAFIAAVLAIVIGLSYRCRQSCCRKAAPKVATTDDGHEECCGPKVDLHKGHHPGGDPE